MSEATAYTSADVAAARAPASARTPRHLKITGVAPAYGFEPCEDVSCSVDPDGTASSCGRLACPSCGCGGTNLTLMPVLGKGSGTLVRCSCGCTWVRAERHAPLLSAPA